MNEVKSLTLRGAPGSPYTRKMLAVLRYRRIPYRLLIGTAPARQTETLPEPKVALLPTFYLPGDDGAMTAVVDSTPIIRLLEQRYLGRSVLPTDPGLAFLNYLLEDYGDEWLTKAMFHYRWHYAADIQRAGQILPRWRNLKASEEEIAPLSAYISERQISRLYVVGSSPATAPVIEDSYKRFLSLLRAHLPNGPFLFGARPSSADFALFGQLTQLTQFDPTPMAIALEREPQVYAWVSVMEDLSGVEADEADWVAREDLPETLRALLVEVGRVYVPALLANARAVDGGLDEVRCEIDGRPWTQVPFPYQAKCLQWIRQEYARLDGADRDFVDTALDGTGCEALMARGPKLRLAE